MSQLSSVALWQRKNDVERLCAREGAFVCWLRLSIVGLSHSLLPSPVSMSEAISWIVGSQESDDRDGATERTEGMEVGNREGWEDGRKAERAPPDCSV